MFDSTFIRNAIDRSAESPLDRRRFLAAAGVTGVGVGAASLLTAPAASAADSGAVTDGAVLNFALNLEYLEAEFYLRATTGSGLAANQVDGSGKLGGVTGGRKVAFKTKAIQQYAEEIAKDEKDHVLFLRSALGGAKVSRPAINLDSSFTAVSEVRPVRRRAELPARCVHLRGRGRDRVQGCGSVDHEQDVPVGCCGHPRC